jgi:hypothetical protein
MVSANREGGGFSARCDAPPGAAARGGERRFGWQLARGFIRASCQPAAKGRAPVSREQAARR